MPDLDEAIRAALRSRADDVVIRETSLRPRSRRSFAPLLAAAVVLLLALGTALVVAHRGGNSSAPPAGGAPDLAGSAWQLVSVRDGRQTTPVPASLDTKLTFSPDGEVVGSDSVNALSGRYRTTGDGYVVTDVASTAAGYAGRDPVRLRVIAAVAACFYTRKGTIYEPHATVRARLDGTTLTLSASGQTLTYRRTGTVGPDPTPSSTAATR